MIPRRIIKPPDLVLDLPMQGEQLGQAGDLVTNGGFDADTDWTKSDAAVTISGGTCSWSGAQAGVANANQDPGITLTKKYRAIYTISGRTAGSIQALVGNGAGDTARSTNGTFTGDVICTGNTTFYLNGDAAFDGSVDDVSLHELYTADVSGLGYHGTVRGATVAQGLYGGGYSFTTDDYITVGNTGGNASTVLIRFKPDVAVDKDTPVEFLVNPRNSLDGLALGASTGFLTNEIISVLDSSNGRSGWTHAADSISAEWHELAIRWNPTDVQYDIILDGVMKTNVTAGTPILLAADDVTIGRRKDTTDAYLNADVDLLKIFDGRNLTDAQIQYEFSRDAILKPVMTGGVLWPE